MLKRVTKEGWENIVTEWEAQCSDFGEDFKDYATASLPVLEKLANQTPRAKEAVYSLTDEEGRSRAVLQANSTLLPKYDGMVLRIRHIVLAPCYDFSDDEDIVAQYKDVLVGVFSDTLRIADEDMPSQHVKFHMKSPAEREFGKLFTAELQKTDSFAMSAMKGSWIYLSKR